jgi:hypothetical protein
MVSTNVSFFFQPTFYVPQNIYDSVIQHDHTANFATTKVQNISDFLKETDETHPKNVPPPPPLSAK